MKTNSSTPAKMIGFTGICLIMFATVNLHGQSAKKCFENGAMYESLKKYREALHWYDEGKLQGKSSNIKIGLNHYYRVAPLYINEQLKKISDNLQCPALEDSLKASLDDINELYQHELITFEFYPEYKDQFKVPIIVPVSATQIIFMKYMKESEYSLVNTRVAAEKKARANEALEKYSNYPFMDKKSFELLFWTKDVKKYYHEVSERLIRNSCDDVHKVIGKSLSLYVTGNYRKAYFDLEKILDWGKKLPQGECDAIVKGSDLQKKILEEGQSRCIIMPVKSGQGEFSKLSEMLVNHLNRYNDVLLKVLSIREYEDLLYQNNISMDELYNANPVILGKLNKALNIRYVIMPKVVKLREVQPVYNRREATAYAVFYDVNENGIKEWYTDGSATYYKVKGKKEWDIAIEFKIFDTFNKQILDSKTEEFSHFSEVEFYDGLSDPAKYADRRLAHSAKSCCFTGLDTKADGWRSNFKNSREFQDTFSVLNECEQMMLKKVPLTLYHVLNSQ